MLESNAQTESPSSDIRDIRRSAMDLLARREHSRLDGVDASWRDAALAARDKKFGPQPATDLTEKVRQQKFLIYRGFRQAHFDGMYS